MVKAIDKRGKLEYNRGNINSEVPIMSDSLIPDKTLYSGRPADSTSRLPREVAAYDLLESLSIPFERLDHEALFTIEACHEADAILGVAMCKNLFLCNQSKTEFHLLLMPGEKRFKTKTFSRLIGSSRLSFAPEEAMESLLGLTPGSVTVLGLMNDREGKVKLYIDAELLREEYMGCHPCINTSSIKVKTEDLIRKFLPAVGHGYTVVELPWEE